MKFRVGIKGQTRVRARNGKPMEAWRSKSKNKRNQKRERNRGCEMRRPMLRDKIQIAIVSIREEKPTWEGTRFLKFRCCRTKVRNKI